MPESLLLRCKRITGRMNGRDFFMIVDPQETDIEQLRSELMSSGGADVRISDMKIS